MMFEAVTTQSFERLSFGSDPRGQITSSRVKVPAGSVVKVYQFVPSTNGDPNAVIYWEGIPHFITTSQSFLKPL
ncbi:hypothetical protein [Acetobacterium tundrae]|uniref:Uncharacterized protein n=1 Tax=Acetobacterium tundrae TaxID=132932 RepID=A0ABR6WNH8_9FIRM|nr:hypothetical protein [Acetobacterium tundrae]MBC3798005.1 hypothetical protein [Acetobacterium tundrae]